jgi:DNA polymerase-3 subunit beta
MVATDGHRLAMVETEHKFEGFSQETRVLVPKKAMTEIQRLAAESGDEASLEFGQDESHLFFRFGSRLLTSRKLTGQFPNYEAVLPREVNKNLVLERGELQDALRRVSQLADLRTHAVRFVLAKEGVEISASSPEYGEAKEAIDKQFEGDPITIGFNAQYLLDFLAAAPDGPISFEMKDDQSASQLKPLADESSRYRYIVMPMRI